VRPWWGRAERAGGGSPPVAPRRPGTLAGGRRDRVPGAWGSSRDVLGSGDEELGARLRALRAEMPRRQVGTVFPAVVRARARRRRARLRAAGAVALVAAVVAGVLVPASLAAGRPAGGARTPSAVAAGGGGPLGYPRADLSYPASSAPAHPPDEATAAAVRAAFHDVFTHDSPAAAFTGALQDGQALRSVSDKIDAQYPRLAATITVTLTTLNQAGLDTVSVSGNLSFTEPKISSAPYTLTLRGEAVRTAGIWQVTRGTYCTVVSPLGPAYACPGG